MLGFAAKKIIHKILNKNRIIIICILTETVSASKKTHVGEQRFDGIQVHLVNIKVFGCKMFETNYVVAGLKKDTKKYYLKP